MRLVTFRVTSFKSVKDSETVNVGDVTCLVGRNESGKTALLQALYRLNPIIASQGKFDVTEDYPRADEEDYQQQIERKEIEPAEVVDARFTLEEPELKAIEAEFGPHALKEPTLRLSKGYDNLQYHTLWVNEEAICEFLISKAGLSDSLASENSPRSTLRTLSQSLEARAKRHQADVSNAQAAANAIGEPDAKAKALANALTLQEPSSARALREHLAKILPTGIRTYIYSTHVNANVPKFLYFD